VATPGQRLKLANTTSDKVPFVRSVSLAAGGN